MRGPAGAVVELVAAKTANLTNQSKPSDRDDATEHQRAKSNPADFLERRHQYSHFHHTGGTYSSTLSLLRRLSQVLSIDTFLADNYGPSFFSKSFG